MHKFLPLRFNNAKDKRKGRRELKRELLFKATACLATDHYNRSITVLLLRPCDSRNINLTPFCNLSSTEDPRMWGKDILDTYSGLTTLDHIKSISSSLRMKYPTKDLKSSELVSSLTQVSIFDSNS